MADVPWSIGVSEDFFVEQFSPSTFIACVLGSNSPGQALCGLRSSPLSYSPALSSFLSYCSHYIRHLLFENYTFDGYITSLGILLILDIHIVFI